eukprot:CAMPEP_0116047172 /NCGR_PEP_ID=MMETSP0321-20121206/28713_1 /TAXON_ID=163516 /ORGANISM="Leptocylindrus danicus var. danicus, Strain B650" /LENGTH=222 /DNA_ID=CAMNT_0003528961 /DNA_START=585 /DNA_END=1253 /DNA_ORIENTATION=+
MPSKAASTTKASQEGNGRVMETGNVTIIRAPPYTIMEEAKEETEIVEVNCPDSDRDLPICDDETTTECSQKSDDSSDGSSTSKSVRFSSIDIYMFSMQLGNNPSCVLGPPVRLGELLSIEENRSIEEYESSRESKIRKRKQLYLDPTRRTDILLISGYDQCEIDEAIVKAHLVKKERAESVRLSRSEQSSRDPFRKLIGLMRRRMNKMKRHIVLFSHRHRNR